MHTLSVVIPAFNEGPRIAGTIAEVLTEAERWCHRCEILVVDDGRADDTGAAGGTDPRPPGTGAGDVRSAVQPSGPDGAPAGHHRYPVRVQTLPRARRPH